MNKTDLALETQLSELRKQERSLCHEATAHVKSEILRISREIKKKQQAERDVLRDKTLMMTAQFAELFQLVVTIQSQGVRHAFINYSGHVHSIDVRVTELVGYETVYDASINATYTYEGNPFDEIRSRLLEFIEEGKGE